MSLIEKLKKENDEAFNDWFETWYKNKGLEDKILNSNRSGYKGLNLQIHNNHNSTFDPTKETQLRLRDPRTVERIAEELGDGFTVEHKIKTENYNLFGARMRKVYEYILIRW